jgi:glycosyltransferase involved in cell wall biosynthesis
VPYPPDYGGVFDLFCKIKELHKAGIKIHLHCFEYGRGEQPELQKYCETIFYYRRKKYFRTAELRLPYIVSSRINQLLIKNLLQDDYPVLMEGIHCTYYLYNGQLAGRKVLVRLHNVEFQYYRELSRSAVNVYKKMYYRIESRLLKKYEKRIAKKAKFLTVNKKDKETYQTVFSAKDVEFLPVFLPFNEVQSQTGKGNFCLYHGNLSVAENEKAARWLLDHVFPGISLPFVIAGKDPSSFLKSRVEKNRNVELVQNPSEEKMDTLIRSAHIHLLPSFNLTGIKIKLLNALFNGRFIITNSASVEGTGLKDLCMIAEDAKDYKEKLSQLSELPFTEKEIVKRKEILSSMYDNEKNAQQLIRWL